MNRKLIGGFAIIIAVLFTGWTTPAGKPVPEFYQLTVYTYSSGQQEKMLDHYLEYALVPALHRNGISKAGVFKAMANDTAAVKKIYVLFPVKNLEMITKLKEKLLTDDEYQSAGTAYINTDYKNPAFDRAEVILLKAFPLAPQLQVPKLIAPKKDRVYELRSYESASEKIFRNKVHMFNEGDEISIFRRLNFNAVFYSEVIAGNKMPNLMYMTSFESMEDRNTHWKAFSSDSIWKKLSSMPEYKNNVSHIDISFLHGTEYSDF
ncbi:MAG: NIPSNAP family protein [Ferruginibacter sp.]